MFTLGLQRGGGVIFNDESQNWQKNGKRLISVNSNNFVPNTQFRIVLSLVYTVVKIK